MDLQQLRLFTEVIRRNSITRAADQMNITQSAASQSLARLEEELGTRLFERKRRLEITPEGEIFSRHAVNILNEYEIARQEILNEHGVIAGTIRLKVLASSALIPELLNGFLRIYPRVTVLMNQSRIENDFDLCISTGEMDSLPSYAQLLLTEELMLAVPADSRAFQGRESIDLSETGSESYLLMSRGSQLRKTTDKLFSRAGINPSVIFEGDNPSMVRELIAMGLGIAFLPRITWQNVMDEKIRLLHINRPLSTRSIYIFPSHNGGLSRAVIQFMQYTLDYFRSLSPLADTEKE